MFSKVLKLRQPAARIVRSNVRCFSNNGKVGGITNIMDHIKRNQEKTQEEVENSISNSIREEQANRAPQQGEIRFVENILYDSEEEDVVPEIYREHRHRFSKQPDDIDAYKRQIMYRSSHIGTKELEIVLSDWLTLNQHKMSYQDVEEYDH